MKVSYGISRKLPGVSIEDARSRVEAALGEVGFGILTEIDVKTTLKNKLDAEIRPYHILGACNPGLAQQAIAADDQIGLLMPCNVVVGEDAGGDTFVSMILTDALKPMLAPGSGVASIMDEAGERLRQALAAL